MNTLGLIAIFVAAGVALPGGVPGRTQKRSAADPCASASTQLEMNECAGREYKKADAEMNKVYKALMAKRDLEGQGALREAQRLWLQFRDAHLQAIYPSSDPRAYGSVHPMCVAIILAQLTAERTKHLKRMLEPKEGDVCGY